MPPIAPWLQLADPSRTDPVVDEVVTRWVVPSRSPVEWMLRDPHAFPVGDPIGLGGRNELRLDTGFTPASRDGHPTWRARGRLGWHGPALVRFARVDVEVTMWDATAAELNVRPIAHRVLAWGHRRERRYFDAAHAAATHVARTLALRDAGAPVSVDHESAA